MYFESIEIHGARLDPKAQALSRRYKHFSGDMIPDPDMVIEIDPKNELAIPITYHEAYIYQDVQRGADQYAGN